MARLDPQLATPSKNVVTDSNGDLALADLPVSGFTPGSANLVHAGTWTAYATLTLAKADAVSGDTIYVSPGTYDEKDLLKDGVNWYFLPGAIVAYTGAVNGAIFDDGALGTNGAVTCTIGGYGVFSNTGSGGSGSKVLNVANASVISFSFESASGSIGSNILEVNSASAVVSVKCTKIEKTGTSAYCVSLSAGTLYLTVDLLREACSGSSSGCALYLSGGTSYVVAKRIEGKWWNTGIIRVSNGTHYVDAEYVVSTGSYAVSLYGGTLYLRAHAVVGASYGAIANNSGTLYLSAFSVYGGASGGDNVISGGGTTYLDVRRILATAASGVYGIRLSSSTVYIMSTTIIVCHASTTDAVEGAYTLTIYGTLASNKACNINVTVAGPGVQSFSDATVV